MADFDTWIKETKTQLTALNSAIDNSNSEMNGSITKLKTFRDDTGNIYTNLKTTSSTMGNYFRANENLRSALSTLAFIGHDAETIIDVSYFLKRSGIDLSRILSEDINQEEIQVSQNGTAKLVDSSDACSTVNDGYLGIVIPLKITVLGQQKMVDLTASIFLNHNDYESKALIVQLSHNATYCPENAFNLSTGLKFLNFTQPIIESRLQNYGYNMGDITIGSRPTILYGASLNKKFLRIYISFGFKGKRKMPVLTGPLLGFDVLIKLGNDFIRDAVAAEISRLGLSISSGPIYNSPSSFSLSIQYTYSDSIKIGCVTIGYKIVVEAKVNVVISVLRRSKIIMQVDKLTEPQIVEITGDWIPGIDLIKKVTNLFLSRFEKALDFTQTYSVEQNQTSMSLELTPQFLILKLNM